MIGRCWSFWKWFVIVYLCFNIRHILILVELLLLLITYNIELKLISIWNCSPMLRSAYIRFNFNLFSTLIRRLIKWKHLLSLLNSLSIEHIWLLSKMDLAFRSTSRFQNNLTWWNCLYDFLSRIFIFIYRLFFYLIHFTFIFKLTWSCCHLAYYLNIISVLINLFLKDIFVWFRKLNLLLITYNFCLIKLCQHRTAWLSISIVKLLWIYWK